MDKKINLEKRNKLKKGFLVGAGASIMALTPAFAQDLVFNPFTKQPDIINSIKTINVSSSSHTLEHKQGDYLVVCDASSNNITLNLPSSNNCRAIYRIHKSDSSVNTITVDPNSSETINGDTTKTILFQNTTMIIVCDGNNWFIS